MHLLYDHFINRTLQAMLDEKDELYDVVLKNLAKAGAEAPTSEPHNDDGDPSGVRGNGGKGRGRGRGRAGRAVGGVDARAALLARLKAAQDAPSGGHDDEDEEEDGDGGEDGTA